MWKFGVVDVVDAIHMFYDDRNMSMVIQVGLYYCIVEWCVRAPCVAFAAAR